jgi:hypothetical protein
MLGGIWPIDYPTMQSNIISFSSKHFNFNRLPISAVITVKFVM